MYSSSKQQPAVKKVILGYSAVAAWAKEFRIILKINMIQNARFLKNFKK